MKLQMLVQLSNLVDNNLYCSNHMLVQAQIVIHLNINYLKLYLLSISNLTHTHQNMVFLYNHLKFLNFLHL